METIGDKIKGLRKSKGLSLMELANKLNVSDTAISKIETGKTKSITIELGKGLCNELGVSFYELFEIKTDGPDIKKMQTELVNLNSVLKEKNDRIEEKDILISSLTKANQHLKSELLTGIFLIYLDEAKKAEKFLENIKDDTARKKIYEEMRFVFDKVRRDYQYYISIGALDQKDIAEYLEFNNRLFKNYPFIKDFPLTDDSLKGI